MTGVSWGTNPEQLGTATVGARRSAARHERGKHRQRGGPEEVLGTAGQRRSATTGMAAADVIRWSVC